MRTLSPDEARKFYDRFGKKQDRQTFYEAPALDELVRNAGFGNARSVFELGCGTGRFARELLRHHLPSDATYRGIDLSATMIRLASERLEPFGSRAAVAQASGESGLPVADASVDRLVSTYVLDLLPDATVREVLVEVRRVLAPSGLFCAAGITHGTTRLSRIVMGAWQMLFARNPSWVGGCRPTDLAGFLRRDDWDLRFHSKVVAWGIASEVLVAAPVGRNLEASRVAT